MLDKKSRKSLFERSFKVLFLRLINEGKKTVLFRREVFYSHLWRNRDQMRNKEYHNHRRFGRRERFESFVHTGIVNLKVQWRSSFAFNLRNVCDFVEKKAPRVSRKVDEV